MSAQQTWIDAFPGLAGLAADARASLCAQAAAVQLPAGSRIYGPGQSPQSFLLLLEGSLRVQQVSESGHAIVLYRVSAGESCPLTTACLMGYEDYPAEAVAETDVRAIAIPRGAFDEQMAHSAQFRRFVFTAFSNRITDLFRLIEDVAFSRMDLRLAAKLLELSHQTGAVAATQAQIAAELGTAREVVSRMLLEFQRRGWVGLSRGHIAILDRGALQAQSSRPA